MANKESGPWVVLAALGSVPVAQALWEGGPWGVAPSVGVLLVFGAAWVLWREARRLRAAGVALAVALVGGTPSASAQAEAWSAGGYVEGAYGWNLGQPASGVNALRGFDGRHNHLSLLNASLEGAWTGAHTFGKVALQAGPQGRSIYGAEPSLGAGPAVAPNDTSLWEHVQQAYGGFLVPGLETLSVEGGLFLSPVGPESVRAHESWNLSRSNLFVALPFYHAGARATLKTPRGWALTLGAFNGWNNAADNNGDKSLLLHAVGDLTPTLALSALYFGGVERSAGSPEGDPWRHLLDAHLTWRPHPRVETLLHANAGGEDGAFGWHAWQAGALYARLDLVGQGRAWLAARADLLREDRPQEAGPIFWPTRWFGSGTLTLDLRPWPQEKVALRLEYRRDQAQAPLFAAGSEADKAQDTVTLGLSVWSFGQTSPVTSP